MNAREAFRRTGMAAADAAETAQDGLAGQVPYKGIMTLDEIAEAEGRIRQAFAEPPEADDLMSEALAEEMDAALAQPYDLPTMVESKRNLFQRAIDKERTEKARRQAVIVAEQREIRHLTASIRSLEDALDALLVSEVA